MSDRNPVIPQKPDIPEKPYVTDKTAEHSKYYVPGKHAAPGKYAVPGKRFKKKRPALRALLFILTVALLFYIGIAQVLGRAPGLEWLFTVTVPYIEAEEYHFDVGRNRVFADMRGSVAAAGSMGVQVFDAQGYETLSELLRLSFPAISSNNGRAIVFDIGGTAVRVFSGSEILAEINTAGSIVSASINRNGWFAVTTQEGLAVRGVVTVYDNSGREVFRFYSTDGYVLSAQVSPDNRYMAVLRLTEIGSQLVFYNLNITDPIRTFDFPGEILLEIRYSDNRNIVAVSTQAILSVEPEGSISEIFGFDGSRLGSYFIGDDMFVIHLLYFGVGYSGSLKAINADGRVLGSTLTQRDVVNISYSDGTIAVLWGDGPAFYTVDFDEIPHFDAAIPFAGVDYLLALGNGVALAASDHSAVVVRTIAWY